MTRCKTKSNQNISNYLLIFYNNLCASSYLPIQAKELWPKHWEPMSKADNLKVVEVKPGTDEYNEVEKQFHSTLSGSPVKKVSLAYSLNTIIAE